MLKPAKKSAPFYGYVPIKQLPFRSGDRITILKGTTISDGQSVWSAKRTYRVRVENILPGQTFTDLRGIVHSWNPKVGWAGRNGKRRHVDINHVPEAWPTKEDAIGFLMLEKLSHDE